MQTKRTQALQIFMTFLLAGTGIILDDNDIDRPQMQHDSE